LILSDKKQTQETLQSEGEYLPYGFGDPDYNISLDEVEENQARIADAKITGEGVLTHHSVLRPYYDEVAACYAYQSYNGNYRDWFYSCHKRDVGFIAYILGKCFASTFKARCEHKELLAGLLLRDFTQGVLSFEQLESSWTDASKLLNQHKSQDDRILKMSEWAMHMATRDPQYLSHEDNAHLTRRSSNEAL